MKKKNLLTYLAGATLLVGSSLSAQAAEIGSDLTNDLGVAVPGQHYEVSTPGDYYTYTPTESGLVKIQTDITAANLSNYVWPMGNQYNLFFAFYENTDYMMQITAESGSLVDGGYQFVINMKADIQYVFGYPSENTDMTAGFSFEILSEEVELDPSVLSSVDPTPGEVIDTATITDILIRSNSGSVTGWDEVAFNYGDQSIILNEGAYENYVTTNGYPEFLQIKNISVLISLAEEAGASSCNFTIKNLVAGGAVIGENQTGNDNVTVEDGLITITYPISSSVTYLPEESTWPETFYNYWETGDENAKATLVFNQNIQSVYEASVVMGTVAPGSVGGENNLTTYSLTPSISGDKVILDFAGVTRSASNISPVTVIVKTVTGENGLTAQFPSDDDLTSTVLYKYIDYKDEAANAGSGDDEIEWNPITWGEDFPSSSLSNTYWILPANEEDDYYGSIYIKSNSDINLLEVSDTNHLFYLDFTSEEENRPAEITATTDEDGNYVYMFDSYNSYFPYYFCNLYYQEVTFSFHKGSFEEEPGVKTYTYGDNVDVLPFEAAIFKSNKDDSAPLGILTNSKEMPKISIEMDLNIGMGTFEATYTTVVTEDGYYAFNIESVGTMPNVIFTNFSFETINITFQDELVEGEEVSEVTYGTVIIDEPFYPDSEQPAWEFLADKDYEYACLYTNSNVNLVEEGKLVISSIGIPDLEWTPVLTSSGWAYNGNMNVDVSYIFTYTGDAEVELTLKEGSAASAPLATPTMVYDADYSSIYICFAETIYQAGDYLDGYFKYPGFNADEDLELPVDGVIVTYNVGDTSYLNNAIKFNVQSIIESYGTGNYVVSLGSGLVRNANYQVNNAFTDSFTVTSTAINSIGAAIEDDAAIYNLQGVKVNKNNLGKGIYIINGKKVVLK